MSLPSHTMFSEGVTVGCDSESDRDFCRKLSWPTRYGHVPAVVGHAPSNERCRCSVAVRSTDDRRRGRRPRTPVEAPTDRSGIIGAPPVGVLARACAPLGSPRALPEPRRLNARSFSSSTLVGHPPTRIGFVLARPNRLFQVPSPGAFDACDCATSIRELVRRTNRSDRAAMWHERRGGTRDGATAPQLSHPATALWHEARRRQAYASDRRRAHCPVRGVCGVG